MKATGVVRRIDDLGRIVIPKEIRRTLRIREGESIEIFIDEDNSIVLKKYSPMTDLEGFAKSYIESIYTNVKHNIFVTDRDNIIAISGPLKKKYIGQPISNFLENSLKKRDNYLEKHKKNIEVSPGLEEEATYCISTINVNGDSIGLVIILSTEKEMTELEEKTTKIAAEFIAKNIED